VKGSFSEVIKLKMRSLGWPLFQYDWKKMGKFADIHIWKENDIKSYREKEALKDKPWTDPSLTGLKRSTIIDLRLSASRTLRQSASFVQVTCLWHCVTVA
jgi:hypothetical protein